MFCKTPILYQDDGCIPLNDETQLVSNVSNVKLNKFPNDHYIIGNKIVGDIECHTCGTTIGILLALHLVNVHVLSHVNVWEIYEGCHRSIRQSSSMQSMYDLEKLLISEQPNKSTNFLDDYSFALQNIEDENSQRLRRLVSANSLLSCNNPSNMINSTCVNVQQSGERVGNGRILLHLSSLILRCE